MGVARLFGLCAALLFASSVSAAITIDLGPSDYKNFGTGGAHTGAGIRSSFGQTVRMPPLSTSLAVTRNAVVPYGAAANAMRSFTSVHPASVAASAAITGLFIAMEWYFDEDLGEWSVREVDTVDPEPGYGWGHGAFCDIPASPYDYPTPQAACDAIASAVGSTGTYNQSIRTCSIRSGGVCAGSTTIGTPGIVCPEGAEFNQTERVCQAVIPVPVIEGEFTRLAGELPYLPATEVASATGDAQRRQGTQIPGYHDTTITGPSSIAGPETTSTSTDPVTGDTTVTNTSTQTNISYGDQTITTTNTTTTTTYQNGQETSTTTTTETPGELPVSSGGGAGDWPGFCEWAGVVCDWFNWTQEEPPPEQDLPAVIDDDFYQEKTISFGAKSCPPDHQIDLTPFLSTSVAVSFQPLCDFAGLIYYMVMAASYIIAAYITIGVARNG